MATRESGGVGIDHLTVVPENLEIEPSADDESTPGDGTAGSALDTDHDGA